MFQATRGTTDLLPQDLVSYRCLEKAALQLAEQYGFEEIRTPLFEKADLFVRGLGVMAGLVERELWTFHDKHGQKLALRADITPCVVRAYLQHKLTREKNQPTKLCYLGPVFLVGKEGDQPSRQAHQFGVEVLGNDSPALDAELMCMALDYCEQIGLSEVRLEMNSLGCEKCRPAYFDALREFFATRQGELCQTCRRKYRNHPTWVLSCPEAGCQTLANLAPTILGYLCQDCKGHFNALKYLVQELELEVSFNPRVVRDLEYYTRTVFRLVCQGRTIGVGGRYDGLVEQLGGADTPAGGFAIYLDEAQALLGTAEAVTEELDFLFLPEGPESIKALLPIALKLRRGGARVEIAYNKLQNQPEARWVVRLAEVNALRGQAEIVEQESRQQEKCNTERLLGRLQHLLGSGPRETEGEGRGARRRLSRGRKERDLRRVLPEASTPPESVGSPSELEVDQVEDAGEGQEGLRRRKRRRRRGDEEEEVVPEARVEGEATDSRDARDSRDSRPAREPREPRGREPRERRETPLPSHSQERRPEPQPVRAFIPSLRLGNAETSPASAPAAEVAVVSKVVKPSPTPALPVGESLSLGNVNWSIKTRLNGGQDEDEGESQVRVRDRAPGRRPGRRR